MTAVRRKLIVDTDPGCDDALALLLAFASPELDVLGITTIMGNAPIGQTTLNALKICELAGRTALGVYQGCARPFLLAPDTAEIVHGRDGMAELDLPAPHMRASSMHAVDWIVQTLMEQPADSVTVVAIGPLTNLALAMVKDRRIVSRLHQVLIMGGSLFAGGNHNTYLAAETNFANDPHAARIVFESGARIVLAPLDLTHSLLATPGRIAAMRGAGTPLTLLAGDIMEFYSRYDVEKMGLPGGPIHDPCLIAYLISPDLFQEKTVFAEVETQSERALGAVIADWWGVTGKEPNATVLHGVDSDGFFTLLTARLSKL